MSTLLLLGHEHRAFAQRCCEATHVTHVIFEQRSLALKRKLFLRRLKRYGTWHVLGQLGHRAYRKLLASEQEDLDIAHELSCTTSQVNDINHPSVVDTIEKHKPDRVVVYGTSLLGRELIRALPHDSFNIHTGLTHHYRGVCSSFWALYEDHPERLGVTIHRLDSGIDTGDIVAMVQPSLDALRNTTSLDQVDRLIASDGETLMLELLSGRYQPLTHRIPKRGNLYSEPTLWQYLEFQERTGLR